MTHDQLAMKNRSAIFALISAGTLWGGTVALSKLSLEWLSPTWLSALRFLVAAPLLALVARRELRASLTPSVMLSGAFGFGAVILLQNAGIAHTSVSHAAIIVGAVPVIVALITAGLGGGTAPPLAWLGYGVALVGIMLVAQGGGGGATMSGDMLVFASVVLSATFIAMQPRVLKGRDAAAVTAVQFAVGGIVALPFALSHGLPHAPASSSPVIAFVALALAGTILPFWLFAHGQSAGRARACRCVRQPRAAGRCTHRLDRLLRPGRLVAGTRCRNGRRRDRAKPSATGLCEPATVPATTVRGARAQLA